MPTILSHAAVAFVVAKASSNVTTKSTRIGLAAMALAALPDVDALFIMVLGMFWTFAAGALVWNKATRWRILLGGGLAAVGVVFWALALSRNG